MRLRVLLLSALVLAGCAAPEPEGPAPVERLPRAIVALGDSITAAANADGAGLGDQPTASWATGSDRSDGIESQYERLLALDAGIRNQAHNVARSGARMSDLARQADEAARTRADFVTILLGANDACAASLDRMTSEEAFRAAFRAGAKRLDQGLPGALVYVVSVPDVTQPWTLFHENETARAIWETFDVCPVALAPEATDADRAQVRARVEAYNRILRDEAEARRYHHDDGAAFRADATREDVSTLDFFHPSRQGQARLAALAWEAGPYARWPDG